MKSYQYQILRFYPDIVVEEFVNVGIVLFVPDERKILARVVNNISRISSLFHGIDNRYIYKQLKIVDKWISTRGEELLNNLNYLEYNSIDKITSLILPANDSSLKFSNVRSGITENLTRTFDELYGRFISKYEKRSEHISKDDKAAWSEYKKVFEKYNIDQKLIKPDVKVKTRVDEFNFDFAWKNGVWNFYKPLSFDLSEEEYIREKTYRWAGITQELLTSELNFNLVYLALSPKVGDAVHLSKLILTKLNQVTDDKKISIVFEQNAEKFAENFKMELDKYK